MPKRDQPRDFRHVPVLADAVLRTLALRPGNVVVDCTLGLGGHSRLMLERVKPDGRLIATDFDPRNIEFARQHLSFVRNGQFSVHNTNFAALPSVLASEGVEKIDALLADLGVASPQIDDPARGFSYRRPGPLDMRMDPSRKESAAQLLARMTEKELRDALLEYGDEDDADKIAPLIVARRQVKPIETTEDLTAIVCEARDFTLQRAAGAKLHPAARTFQALRMLVNREVPNLDRLLAVIPQILKPGGRVAIISFHSGEDRRVKKAFRDMLRDESFEEAPSDPIIATEAELRDNPRSRSAKLRWAVRA
ncbi:MAG TPA: 16S rRNA (cytosine(1402)-N(4))-methyltransferase RsmH [Tepidisphaeraceae bacterium]|jgi:16S rRNA (cytosine1402-N4)-methyltransferase|nr:16S rRNA (cytosine(1402)-N(4))-methyltransferase RsmH [Tepidisphaeraceae bacterium]